MWEELINEVEGLGLSFDEFLALYKIYSYEYNSRKIYYESDMLNTYIDLETKGLIKVITNENTALTFQLREAGRSLMESFVSKDVPVKQDSNIKTVTTEKKKTLTNENKFEEFWMTFPSSDEHGIYRRSRILKAGKEMCKKKYLGLLAEGVNHDDVIKALTYEIRLRKDSNNKSNNMTYMKNSLTWLNQREYEVILETMSEDDNKSSENDWTSNAI